MNDHQLKEYNLIGEKYLYIKYEYANYSHALIDTIPIMLVIRNFFPDIIFLLSEKPFKTINRIVNELKIKNLNLTEAKNINSIDSVPSIDMFKFKSGNYLTSSLQELRSNLKLKKESPKKILIKRYAPGRTKQRNISLDLSNYIKSLGFTEITCSNYSVSEQANLFYNAEIIISPHSSDLANIIFCNNGCNIIELNNGRDHGYFSKYIKNGLDRYGLNINYKLIFDEKFKDIKNVKIKEDEIHETFFYNLEKFKNILYDEYYIR